MLNEHNSDARGEILAIVKAIFDSAGTKNWEELRTLFLDEIEFTVSSSTQNSSARHKMTDLINYWKDKLPDGRNIFQHYVSSIEELDGRTASVLSRSYTYQRSDEGGEDGFRELWGDYTHYLIETETGWKCSAVKLFVPLKSSNYDLKDFADEFEETK